MRPATLFWDVTECVAWPLFLPWGPPLPGLKFCRPWRVPRPVRVCSLLARAPFIALRLVTLGSHRTSLGLSLPIWEMGKTALPRPRVFVTATRVKARQRLRAEVGKHRAR